jgi:hypothetical protein
MILVRRILHIIKIVKNIVLNGREKNILCSLNMSTFSCYDSKGAITTILFQKKIVESHPQKYICMLLTQFLHGKPIKKFFGIENLLLSSGQPVYSILLNIPPETSVVE